MNASLPSTTCSSRGARRRALSVLVLAVVLALSTAAAPALASPLWSSVPKRFACGPDSRIVPSNACVKHTGFKPNAGSGAFGPWWGQARSRVGNCTAYLAYRLMRNRAANFLVPGQGTAVNWKRHATAAGKRVDSKPAVGAVAWWGANGAPGISSSGHVAYVERVSSNGRTVYLSESHFPLGFPGGSRRLVVRKGDDYWPNAFLHVKDRPERKVDPLRRYAGKIVQWKGDRKAQKTAWLVDSELKRRWIPSAEVFQCLKAQGVPGPVRLSAKKLDKLEDLNGVHASCVHDQPPVTPREPTPSPPKGNLDAASSTSASKVRVRGWAFDPDAPLEAVKVRVYVGGKTHKEASAKLRRDDIASAYDGYEDPGPYHGFDITVTTSLKGKQDVCVSAIDLGSQPLAGLGCETVTIKATATAPAVEPPSVKISKGASAQGLTGCKSVYCRFVVVDFKRFSSGAHTVKCRASNGSEGGYYAYSRSGRSGTSSVCFYGFPGHTVWVTVDGVRSNRITW